MVGSRDQPVRMGLAHGRQGSELQHQEPADNQPQARDLVQLPQSRVALVGRTAAEKIGCLFRKVSPILPLSAEPLGAAPDGTVPTWAFLSKMKAALDYFTWISLIRQNPPITHM